MSKKELETYHSKRDFRKTEEPKNDSRIKEGQCIFVIQKHDASQLHYDFRLQIDGSLKSWAVPKGLSTAANEKRLAIRTEDHPLDYAKFEGVIPEGEYGAGTVMVWDFGQYEPLENDDEHKKSMSEALRGGALKFRLEGEKIKGGYAMARMNRGDDDDDEQWVIFKLDDEEADARRNPTSSEPDSVLTGRSLEEIAEEEGKDE
ncbi:DNA polymerase ligase N-terminal domain-containing protein [Legionella yabuuchiae]|uniref:DNA polymerase ligase N-terminal domain-containing protein n=1 Tax=Legionella yabuuchiae TaxID=376727 RepID=UPI0010563A1A|nr:DNA polymerase ligase N-terminal domain-containing protein [Legionella yabuuchiae]